MLSFRRQSMWFVVTPHEPNTKTKTNQPRDAWLKGSIVFGMGTFLMSLGLSGCGNNGPEVHPFTPEQAKASAKYRELHPEEFPVAKKKSVKARRGG